MKSALASVSCSTSDSTLPSFDQRRTRSIRRFPEGRMSSAMKRGRTTSSRRPRWRRPSRIAPWMRRSSEATKTRCRSYESRATSIARIQSSTLARGHRGSKSPRRMWTPSVPRGNHLTRCRTLGAGGKSAKMQLPFNGTRGDHKLNPSRSSRPEPARFAAPCTNEHERTPSKPRKYAEQPSLVKSGRCGRRFPAAIFAESWLVLHWGTEPRMYSSSASAAPLPAKPPP
mmetsp:Transcript_11359/g.36017  ORF Transcript_11359/g.36017 Transcript_11359/m.36017 type:complete len:228 (-) Transcript_11359:435-1118(-)